MRIVLISVLSFLLVACATPSIKEDFAFPSSPGSALLIGSVTTSITDSNYPATSRFIITKSGSDNSLAQRTVLAVTSNSVWGLPDTDFQGAYGKLFAFELPAGNYQIASWNIDNGSNATIFPRNPKPVDFALEAGKATYIGDIHMELRTGKNFFRITIIGGGMPSINDESKRDIPLLLSRYPHLVKDSIIENVLSDAPWGNVGHSKSITPIVLPIVK